MRQTAKLAMNDGGVEKTIELPVVTGTEGEKAVDIGALENETRGGVARSRCDRPRPAWRRTR